MRREINNIIAGAICFSIASVTLPTITHASGGGHDIEPTRIEKSFKTMDCKELKVAQKELTALKKKQKKVISDERKYLSDGQKAYKKGSLELEKLETQVNKEQDKKKKKTLKSKVRGYKDGLWVKKSENSETLGILERAEEKALRTETELKTLKKWLKYHNC